MSRRRYLATVTQQDEVTGGRPVLHGYGRRWLLELAGKSRATLDRAVAAGVDFGDPIQAVAWILRQRGRADLAAQIVEEFGE